MAAKDGLGYDVSLFVDAERLESGRSVASVWRISKGEAREHHVSTSLELKALGVGSPQRCTAYTSRNTVGFSSVALPPCSVCDDVVPVTLRVIGQERIVEGPTIFFYEKNYRHPRLARLTGSTVKANS